MNNSDSDLIDLQTRIAYQEDIINQLNQVVTKQSSDITQLQQQLRLLAKRLDEMAYEHAQGTVEPVSDERPPHY